MKVSDLKNLAKHSPNRDISYLPDEDVRALNIISWARINDKAWTGGRVGKKFDLANGDVGLFKKRNNFEIGEPTVYQVRSGFFSFMRPGHGSLLLNVNIATSAFFPSENLLTWIRRRWNTEIPSQRERHELIGVSVVRLNDPADHEGKRRHYVIRALETSQLVLSLMTSGKTRNSDRTFLPVSNPTGPKREFPTLAGLALN